MGKRTSLKREHYYEWDILFLRCSRCENFKQSIDFWKNKNKPFGLNCYCKECAKIRWKEFYNNNKDRVKGYHKNYYQNNRDNIQEKHKEYNRKTYTTERGRGYQRKYREKNYGIYIERQRAYRKKEYKEKYEKKKSTEVGFNINTFHTKATDYIKNNNLRFNECIVCGKEGKTQAHHPSYDNKDKRKEVVFLCDACHKLVHTGELDCPEPVDLIQLNAHMPVILTDKDLEYATV